MAPRSCSVVSAASALLASESDEQEAQAVATLRCLLETDPQSLATLADVSLLQQLLVYLFTRTYVSELPFPRVFTGEALAAAQSIVALRQHGQQAFESGKLLDCVSQARWSPSGLHLLRDTIVHIDGPRMRQQAVQFGYRVVSRWAIEAAPDWIQSAMAVLLLGVTDVWSAVRKESSRAAKAIVLQFPSIDLIDSWIDSLLRITGGAEWKARDGALLTLAALLSSISVERSPAVTTTAARSTDMIRGGANPSATTALYNIGDRHRGVAQLPRSLTVKLKPTVYSALKHEQLSVREGAALCLALYVEICDESTRVLTFQELMSKLNRLSCEAVGEPSASAVEISADTTAELLEAAEAEGLLDVLAKVVPHLSVAFLARHWKFVFPTLERYVMHVASSVRLRSSAVVLALAELSLFESSAHSQSIDLLHQMLLALAESRCDIGVCWQRLEGRLLSVDLLVGLLGKNHVWFEGVEQSLLHIPVRQRGHHSRIAQAAWTVDEDEDLRLRQAASQSRSSIVTRLNRQLASKQVVQAEMWRRVLQGWLDQTRTAFESTQFELRRIARQVLPGLVRLCLWCDQLHVLSSATQRADPKASDSAKLDGWKWVSLRHLLLHAQHIHEARGVCADTRARVDSAYAFALATLRSVHLEKRTRSDELETVVARVEATLLAHSIPVQSPQDHAVLAHALRCSVRDVYCNLPPSFLHPLVPIDASLAHDGSLDRQLSIAIVHMLPTIAARADDLDLWRMVERVALSWLATDDMFRWITIDKASAHESLLRAVDQLLARPVSGEALACDEIAEIVRTLETAISIRNQRLKDSIADVLARIYVTLWKYGKRSPTDTTQTKILSHLSCLDQQRRRGHATKGVESSATRSDWDDWDGDSADAKTLELRESSLAADDELAQNPTAVAFAINSIVSGKELEALRADLSSLVSTGTMDGAEAVQNLVQSLANVRV